MPIEAKFNIVRNNIQFLTRSLNKQAPLISTFKVTEENSPNLIAKQFRQCLGVQKPVIDNLTKVMEEHGVQRRFPESKSCVRLASYWELRV